MNIRYCISVLALILAGFYAQAQEADSVEVGIAAYWEKGDVFTYQYTNEKYKVDEGGDTTYVSRSGNLKTMKVVSMTDDTYTLKITSSDSWHSDPERSKLLADVYRKCGPEEVILLTDEYGSPLQILNWKDIVKYYEKAKKVMISSVMKIRKGTSDVPEKEMREYLEGVFKNLDNQEIIKSAIDREISNLFIFHGNYYTIDKVYDNDFKVAPLVNGADSLNMHTEYWIDGSVSDDEAVVFRMSTEIPSDEMKSYGKSVFVNALGVPSLYDSTIDMSSVEYIAELIHLDTGIPLRYYYDKVGTTSYPKEDGEVATTQTVESMAVKFYLTEEEMK